MSEQRSLESSVSHVVSFTKLSSEEQMSGAAHLSAMFVLEYWPLDISGMVSVWYRFDRRLAIRRMLSGFVEPRLYRTVKDIS